MVGALPNKVFESLEAFKRSLYLAYTLGKGKYANLALVDYHDLMKFFNIICEDFEKAYNFVNYNLDTEIREMVPLVVLRFLSNKAYDGYCE